MWGGEGRKRDVMVTLADAAGPTGVKGRIREVVAVGFGM